MERRGFCIFNMAQKKLLFIATLIILGSVALAQDIDDLIASQDQLIKKYTPAVQSFITDANKNASRSQLTAQEIIKNSNLNDQQDPSFNWLDYQAAKQQAAFLKTELYIFASLSMPKTRLIVLIKEANNYNGVVVLRGLRNNSYQDTANFLQPIIQEAGAGLIIDPTLFTTYNIERVPVIVVSDATINKYDKITGNISLQYALTEITKNGDLKEQARKILGAQK